MERKLYSRAVFMFLFCVKKGFCVEKYRGKFFYQVSNLYFLAFSSRSILKSYTINCVFFILYFTLLLQKEEMYFKFFYLHI